MSLHCDPWLGIIQCNPMLPCSHPSIFISSVSRAKINACFNRFSAKQCKKFGQKSAGLLSLSRDPEGTHGCASVMVKLCKSFTVGHVHLPESQLSVNSSISNKENFSPADNFWGKKKCSRKPIFSPNIEEGLDQLYKQSKQMFWGAMRRMKAAEVSESANSWG